MKFQVKPSIVFLRKKIASLPLCKIGRLRLILSIGAAAVVIAAWIFLERLFFASWTVDAPADRAVVHIRSGMGLSQIADSLHQHGVLPDRDRFYTAARLSGTARNLKAGTYRFSGRLNNARILRRLVRGDILQIKVTFREGIQSEEMAEILREAVNMDPDSFFAAVRDSEILSAYGIPAPSLEGYLYPDTYYLNSGISAEETVNLMVRHFEERVCDSMRLRAGEIGMSLHEAVTLASIIEGEAALASERPLISALYHNRLERGMRLQADPTIQYIIPDGPRRLLSRDLEIESPYNTYLYAGLPPGPVNNPGIDCIRAALYPAEAPYLYMVANGDGSHTFSTNIRDHLQAKSRFDRVRRNVRRKNRR